MEIAQILPPGTAGWGDVGLDSLTKGIGGRETAVLQLGLKWAEAGHSVTCFVPRKDTWDAKGLGPLGGTLRLVPQAAAPSVLAAWTFDAVVAWEVPEYLAGIRDDAFRVVGMQVAHLQEHDQGVVDRYVALSPWAADFLADQAQIDRARIDCVPNGVDLGRFEGVRHTSLEERLRSPKVIYSSSPDRGLHHLLRLWPRLRREVLGPNSSLLVGYGATRWTSGPTKWSHNVQADVAAEIERGLKQEGVVDLGLVGQGELAELQASSLLMTYTCDTMQPTETGCITVTEALAAELPAVITDCDCLGSEYGDVTECVPLGLGFDDDAYVRAVTRVLATEGRYDELRRLGRTRAEERSWEKTSEQWLSILEQGVAAKGLQPVATQGS